MLTVRDEQIEAFERRFFDAMKQRVEHAIASTFPQLAGTREQAPGTGVEESARLKGIVERGIESAVNLGIDDAPDVAAFIALGLALRLAPPGEGGDWILDWLKRTETGATKLLMIESQLGSLAEDESALTLVAARVAQARNAAAA